MRDDQVLHRDEAVAHLVGLVFGHVVNRHESVDVVGDLHAREVRFARSRVLHEHGQVDRVARDVREGVRGVHGERGEHGEHLLAEVLREALLLGDRQLVPAQQLDVLLRQIGQDVVHHVVRVLVLQAVGLLADRAHLLARAQARRARDGDAGVDAALETGHADHEELVEVAREDRGERGALDDRDVFVLRQFEHALVELEPAQLTVEEAVGRQRLFTVERLAFVALVRLCDMFGDLAAQNRL